MEGIGSVYCSNFRRNSSGKLLVYQLLCLIGIGLPKISTTRDPWTDWCGYPESSTKRLVNLYGEMTLLLDHSKSMDSFSPPFNSTCLHFLKPVISLFFAKCINRRGSDQVNVYACTCWSHLGMSVCHTQKYCMID